MFRVPVFALLCALSLGACAQPAPPASGAKDSAPAGKPASAKAPAVPSGSAERAVLAALAEVVPEAAPDYIGPAPFAGFREVLLDGQVLYVSDDGRYLVQSQPIDLQARAPASSPGLNAFRREALARIPKQDRIVFAPANPVHTITVFTDVECGYCRRMHQQIAEYNRQGIAVEYLAFPRMGMASQDARDMVSVWCANDRRQALTQAKSGAKVASRECTSPVAMQYSIGKQVGVTGTPAVFAPDGTQLGGYVPPANLRATLDRLAGKGQAAGSR
ncbi:thioredoxin fold domain-containing protein [Pseudoxanthomonas suwonensis]|uniref:thioredoxin fold domain-containing protein n=1 Tax=Pseudoxanthomonas suwonensis TaxID=314722 RepID=UPI00138F6278|nr:thioredoxin fold domain-containing protein [Pseudoxanthomonas suwonensis]KAF1704353.1 disulfide bond formation protein DsbC [Pseudoxanthomonas suwonensis]